MLIRLVTALVALTAGPALAADWPAPVQAMADQGLTIHDAFEAPGGLTGYAASYQGQEMAIYLTEDGEHAVVGNLVDAEGNNLSLAPLERLVRAPQDNQLWQDLGNSHWIRDGDTDAPRIVYTFTDPNCAYCRQFWEQTRPWVEAGKVQLRHIMVGILEHDSPRKAVSLLAAEDPSAALIANHHGEPVEWLETLPRKWEVALLENHQLFESLGFQATPSTLYQRDGLVEAAHGLPEAGQLSEVMGSEEPAGTGQ
ncbi:thiol:disulfide interchange protein DsbG [Litchfieldella xinjiangensis]|uniref:thiol:disulfide interchange protein DsbG n=1 Tax=Litchfieldella xinjiangensis TaxID=1166948 RepID=UPI0005BA77F6|nr:thiol:disulfide interchange protein DsbG [Halomonas xinjiangensis]